MLTGNLGFLNVLSSYHQRTSPAVKHLPGDHVEQPEHNILAGDLLGEMEKHITLGLANSHQGNFGIIDLGHSGLTPEREAQGMVVA